MTEPLRAWVDVLFNRHPWPADWMLLVPRVARTFFHVVGGGLKFAPLSIGPDIVGAHFTIFGVGLVLDVSGRGRSGEYVARFPHVARPGQLTFSRTGFSGHRGLDLQWRDADTANVDDAIDYELDGAALPAPKP